MIGDRGAGPDAAPHHTDNLPHDTAAQRLVTEVGRRAGASRNVARVGETLIDSSISEKDALTQQKERLSPT